MSIASVAHSHVFGLSPSLSKENVFYVDENTVLYFAGCNVVVADMDSKAQKFFPATEKAEGISAVMISPDRHVFAVSEKSSKPAINIYDLHSFRKRRTLHAYSESQGTAREFVSLAFSSDTRYLAAQLGGPEWILHYFAWEKGKLIATINTLPPPTSGLSLQTPKPPSSDPTESSAPGRVSFQDRASISGNPRASIAIGNGFGQATMARAAANHGGSIIQISICPTDGCQIGVLSERFLKILHYFEGAFQSSTPRLPPFKELRCHAWLQNERIAIGTSDADIFILANGELLTEMKFGSSIPAAVNPIGALTHLSVAPQANTSTNATATTAAPIVPSVNVIISIGRGLLAAGVGGAVEVYEKYADSSNGKGESYKMMWKLPLPDENQAVRSMAVSGICELSKYFPEEAYSVSLHPSGLYLLVGFSDKLRLLNVLMDDFRLFKEFGIRGCRECRFSHGGHIFAAVHGNMIQLYSTWTFDNIGNLKGHNGKVRSLYWTPDDNVLVSAGSDGAVYTWFVKDLKRESEHILKSCNYTSAVCSINGKSVFAVGSDKVLKEINESTVTCQVETNAVLTQVAISHNGKMMFAGTSTGQIRSLKFPLTGDSEDFQEHQAHSGAVTKLRVSYDDQFLFSVSEDGCMYVYRISDKDDRTLKRERSLQFADEILITKSDLEEKTILMSELQRSLEELKLEHEYQLRLKDMNFNEKLKEITEKYSQEIEALKISTSVLRTEKDKEEVKHEEELQGVKAKHMQELHEIETKYNQQLMEEYEKFQDLQANAGSMQEQWQKQMKDFEGATQRALSDAQAEAEARLNMKSAEIARLHDETHQQLSEFEEMARQNNEDIDSEIQILSARYEKKLRAEREEGARLKGENGIMRKKFNTLNKDIEDNKNEIQRMRDDEKKLKGVISMLEKEIATFKKDMAERDELIQDKERRVYDLKKKNQELEKFKFVLDFRIKELKEQVEPRENNIQEMTGHIRDINFELEILNKQKGLLEEEIGELTSKLDTTKKDYANEHRHLHDITHYLKVFRNELQDAIQYIQEPSVLKKCVENLHKKYCTGITDLSHSGIDKDVKREYLRQHEVLKDQIMELRAAAEKNMTAYRADNVHSMMENQLLIGEINALRKATRGKLRKIKSAKNTSETAIMQVLAAKPMPPGQLHKGVQLPELRAPPGLPSVPFFKNAMVAPASS
ncbi:Cilia- and flagella-associated protein 57 [Phlyctochytrium planicorne]|nr:Cilia- and flagella-associated protein 57 [Phlyctochytrium planicorne]